MRLLDPNLLLETADGWALKGQECRGCGRIAFPRKRVCPDCFGDDLADRPLSRTGTLHTFTRTVLGAPHLNPPYVIGLVDLPEKIKVLSLIVDCDPGAEGLQVGMPVELVIGRLREGPDGEGLYGPQFRPISLGDPT